MLSVLLVAYVMLSSGEKRYVILDESAHLSMQECREEKARLMREWVLPVRFHLECEEET